MGERILTARAASVYKEDWEDQRLHLTNLVELRLDGKPAYFIQDLGNPDVYHFLCSKDMEGAEKRMDETGAQPYEFENCDISPGLIIKTIFEEHDQPRGSRLLVSLAREIKDAGLDGMEA